MPLDYLSFVAAITLIEHAHQHLTPMQQPNSIASTPLPWILKICATKRGEQCYIIVINNNNQNNNGPTVYTTLAKVGYTSCTICMTKNTVRCTAYKLGGFTQLIKQQSFKTNLATQNVQSQNK